MQKYLLSVEDINSDYCNNFTPVRNISSIEDVATLIETFEYALSKTTSKHIVDVVENSKRYYFFVISTKGNSNFDFYTFLNSKYRGSVKINPVNAKLNFPLSKSRGVYDTDFDIVEESTDNVEEELATGFMDEEELEQIVSGEKLHLLYLKMNTKIPITTEGVVIGRSSKQAQFIISGNSNVSRKHARVFRLNGNYYLENYQPPNGTFLNGLRLQNGEKLRIEKGSEIILAGEEFKVV